MQIAFCAAEEDQKVLRKVTLDYYAELNCYPAFDSFENRESLIEAMMKNTYSIVIVAVDKAKGLETVKHIHRHDKNIKIIWFSDDKDFAGSAFEYGIDYFAQRPITRDKIEEGLRRYQIIPEKSDVCRVHLKTE